MIFYLMLYKGAAICASFVVVVDSLAKPNKRADLCGNRAELERVETPEGCVDYASTAGRVPGWVLEF